MTEVNLLSEDEQLRRDIVKLTLLSYRDLPKDAKFIRSPDKYYTIGKDGTKFSMCGYSFTTKSICIGNNFYDICDGAPLYDSKAYKTWVVLHEIGHHRTPDSIIKKLGPGFLKYKDNDELSEKDYPVHGSIYHAYPGDYSLLEGWAEYYAMINMPRKYRDTILNYFKFKIRNLDKQSDNLKIYVIGMRDQLLQHGYKL